MFLELEWVQFVLAHYKQNVSTAHQNGVEDDERAISLFFI